MAGWSGRRVEGSSQVFMQRSMGREERPRIQIHVGMNMNVSLCLTTCNVRVQLP